MYGTYNGEVREIPYQDAQDLVDLQSERLHDIATGQLETNYREKGDGWQDEPPRYHFWKGIDELFSAAHHADQGNPAHMDRRLADGLNHLYMAVILVHDSYDGGDDGGT